MLHRNKDRMNHLIFVIELLNNGIVQCCGIVNLRQISEMLTISVIILISKFIICNPPFGTWLLSALLLSILADQISKEAQEGEG